MEAKSRLVGLFVQIHLGVHLVSSDKNIFLFLVQEM